MIVFFTGDALNGAIGLDLKNSWGVYGKERNREIEKSGLAVNMHLH